MEQKLPHSSVVLHSTWLGFIKLYYYICKIHYLLRENKNSSHLLSTTLYQALSEFMVCSHGSGKQEVKSFPKGTSIVERPSQSPLQMGSMA